MHHMVRHPPEERRLHGDAGADDRRQADGRGIGPAKPKLKEWIEK
jgi:hypothetical protein